MLAIESMFNRQWATHPIIKLCDPSTYPSSIRTELLQSVLEQADLGWLNQNDRQEMPSPDPNFTPNGKNK